MYSGLPRCKILGRRVRWCKLRETTLSSTTNWSQRAAGPEHHEEGAGRIFISQTEKPCTIYNPSARWAPTIVQSLLRTVLVRSLHAEFQSTSIGKNLPVRQHFRPWSECRPGRLAHPPNHSRQAVNNDMASPPSIVHQWCEELIVKRKASASQNDAVGSVESRTCQLSRSLLGPLRRDPRWCHRNGDIARYAP